MSAQIRQDIANPSPAFAVLLEVVRRAQHLGRALDKSEPLALKERIRAWLHVQLVEHRLVIEQVLLWRTARHVQIDDALGFGSQLRFLRRKGIGRAPLRVATKRVGSISKKRGQGDAANAS